MDDFYAARSGTIPPLPWSTFSPPFSLSADWVLPKAWGQWAIDRGYSEATIRLEAEKFRNHWVAKSGKHATKLDWEATWRNWMLNSAKQTSSRGPPQPKPKSEFMQHQDAVQRVLDEARGVSRNDQFTGDTVDLGSGDYFSH